MCRDGFLHNRGLEIMRTQDFVKWRESMGWSQQLAAHKLGVGLRTVQRREKGTLPITRETQLACRYLAILKAVNDQQLLDNSEALEPLIAAPPRNPLYEGPEALQTPKLQDTDTQSQSLEE